MLPLRLLVQRPLSNSLIRSKVSTWKKLNVKYPNVNSYAAFQTTPRRQIPPFLWVIVKPVAKVAAALTGRGLRKWWTALPHEHKKSVWARVKEHWYMFAMMGGGICVWSIYFYKSHIVPAPITGRERFIVVTQDQLLKITEASAQTILEENRDALVPTGSPLFQQVLKIANHLVMSNPELQDIASVNNWKLTIVKGPEVNASVLPNGHVFVYTGLINFAQNEDQIAMVLGHEMAHALLSHSAENLSYAQLLDVVIITVMAALWMIMPTDGIAVVTNWFYHRVMSLLLHLPYSRKLEKEADSVGLRIAAKACYDIREASVFWQRMSMANDLGLVQETSEWLSTHPASEKRAKHLNFLIPEYEKIRASCSCPPLPALDPLKRIKPVQNAVAEHITAKKSGQNLRRVPVHVARNS